MFLSSPISLDYPLKDQTICGFVQTSWKIAQQSKNLAKIMSPIEIAIKIIKCRAKQNLSSFWGKSQEGSSTFNFSTNSDASTNGYQLAMQKTDDPPQFFDGKFSLKSLGMTRDAGDVATSH